MLYIYLQMFIFLILYRNNVKLISMYLQIAIRKYILNFHRTDDEFPSEIIIINYLQINYMHVL